MFNFDITRAQINTALIWEKLPIFKFSRKLKILSFVLSIIFFVFFIIFVISEAPEKILKIFLGFSLISFSSFFVFWLIELFFNLRLKNPNLGISLEEVLSNPLRYNLAEFLSFEVAKVIKKSFRFMKGSVPSPTVLLYFLLKENPMIDFILLRMLFNPEEIKNKLKEFIEKEIVDNQDEVFQNIIFDSIKIASEKKHLKIEIGDFLFVLIDKVPILKEVFVLSNIKVDDFKNMIWILEKINEQVEERKKFWKYENLMKGGTLAKEWIAGYTISLNKYAIDITKQVRNINIEFVSHKKERQLLAQVLSRREINNALIVGESGSGRRSVVYGFAHDSLSGKSLPDVNYKRVVQLDMPSLLAEVQNNEEIEVVLNKIFEEAVFAGNVILVIDEFHNYIGQEVKPGVIDIAGIITPYLRLPSFQIIAITNYEGLHRYVERNQSVLSFFEKIEIKDITPEETLLILETSIPVLENKYKIFISYPAIRDVVSLSERYIPALPFPEKALEVLDAVAVYVSSLPKEERIVLPQHVAKVITEKTEIPVGEIQSKEKEVLLNLENLIHQRIVNQNEAVKEIATALRRARSDITIRKGPMGAFLFLGPTGVGKTETAKALAEFYFGSEERMIRIDMSEFQQINDISRLIGSPEEIGLLTQKVNETPFSLVLLDEFEKAHRDITNLFLQIFDEGYITDGLGRKIDFKNTIIIATSNAGYQIILQVIKEITEGGPFLAKEEVKEDSEVWQIVKKRLLDFIFNQGIFRPELVNRFDAVVVFRPLTKKNVLDIVDLMLQKLKKNLFDKGIDFLITEELKEKIAELGYNPTFGAREIKRVIQENVENVLATALLRGDLKRGSRVKINPENFSLIINP